jgi:hypothetical protein
MREGLVSRENMFPVENPKVRLDTFYPNPNGAIFVGETQDGADGPRPVCLHGLPHVCLRSYDI